MSYSLDRHPQPSCTCTCTYIRNMTVFSQLDMTNMPTGSTFLFESTPHNPPIDFYDEALKCSGCYNIIFAESSHLVEQHVTTERTYTAYFHSSHDGTVCVWTGYADSFQTVSVQLSDHRKRRGDHEIQAQASKRIHVT